MHQKRVVHFTLRDLREAIVAWAREGGIEVPEGASLEFHRTAPYIPNDTMATATLSWPDKPA